MLNKSREVSWLRLMFMLVLPRGTLFESIGTAPKASRLRGWAGSVKLPLSLSWAESARLGGGVDMTLPTAPRARLVRTGDEGKGIVQLALRTAMGEQLEMLFSGIDA